MNKNSMTLEFKVNKQHLERVDRQKIVEKSENYLWAHFIFSSDWTGLKKYMLARPLTAQDTTSDYKLELDENNKCKIPFDLNLFPGFIISAYGEVANEDGTNTKVITDSLGVDDNLNIMSNVVITTDAQSVDIDSATLTSGEEELAVRYVTSNNHTIIIHKYQDILDLGIETEFEYDETTYTLYLYAITYDDNQEKIRTLLSSIELSSGIKDITTELSYTDPETGLTTYRNLVFTYSNGTTKRVSLDYFWDEIRSNLSSAVINLNLRIDNEVATLNSRITSEVSTINGRIDDEVSTLNQTISNLDTRLTNAINKEIQDRIDDVNSEETRAIARENQIEDNLNQEIARATNVEDELQTQITVETQRALGAEEDLSNAIQQEITTREQVDNQIIDNLDEETTRAIIQEEVLNDKIETETQNRQVADNNLQHNIDVEAQNRYDSDTNLQTQITNEATTRANKDLELQTNINNEETRAKSVEDTLNTNLNNEITRATNKENALETSISNEASARAQADTNIINSIGTNEDVEPTTVYGYINSQDTSIRNDLEQVNTNLSNAIQEEQDRATSREVILDAKIDGVGEDLTTKSTELNTKITQEKNRATQRENAIEGNLNAHTSDINNPHQVTKAQVGLGSVVNTSDSDTPLENGTTKFTTGGAYTLQQSLEGEISTLETTTNNKLNVNVHIEGSSDEITYNGDTVTKTSPYKNLNTGVTGSRSEVIHLANDTTAGLMSHTDYIQIRANTSRIENLEGQTTRLIYTDSTSPTQQDIQDFVDDYLTSIGVSPITEDDYAGIAVVIKDTYHIWHYYSNDNIGWRDDGQDTVSQFTNSIAGIIKGKQQDGFVYAELDGTGSVYGWSTLAGRVTDVENNKVENSTLGSQSDTGTSTTYGYINTQDANLQSQINSEVTTRQQEVEDLQDQVDDEVVRALASEEILSDDIDNYSFKNVSSQDISTLVASAKNNVWQ